MRGLFVFFWPQFAFCFRRQTVVLAVAMLKIHTRSGIWLNFSYCTLILAKRILWNKTFMVKYCKMH